MSKDALLQEISKEVHFIQSFSSFEDYFKATFDTSVLKGIKLKIFRKMALDFYNAGLSNCVITKYKFNDLKELLDTGSISYMGKYGIYSIVKLNDCSCDLIENY